MKRKRTIFVAVLALNAITSACDDPEKSGFADEDGIDRRDTEFLAECDLKYKAQVDALDFKKVGIITDLTVVEDKCRTTFDPVVWAQNNCAVGTQGRWSFWFLASQAAGTQNVSGFILKWLESFETQPVCNGEALTLRGDVRKWIIDPWRVKSGCAVGKKYADDQCILKPEFAPFRLLAVVNRMDLRPDTQNIIPNGYGGDNKDTAGEGRFVFGFLTNTGTKLRATAIFEYFLPTASKTRVQWATDWMALNGKAFGAATFNPALQAITDKFVVKGAFPGKPNSGSALNNFRTNELDFAAGTKKWSLRTFQQKCVGMCDNNALPLLNVGNVLTPGHEHENSLQLLEFMNKFAVDIREAKHIVPLTWDAVKFQTCESISNPKILTPVMWGKDLLDQQKFDDMLNGPDTRRTFAIGTCSGCHYMETDNGLIQHVIPAGKGFEANLSLFLNPGAQPHLVPGLGEGEPEHEFNEPRRRLCELAHTKTGAGHPLSNFFGGH